MLRILYLVGVFLISPLVGVIILQIFLVAPYIWPIGGGLSLGIEALMIGVMPILIMYMALLLISIPVFTIIRIFLGWNLWACVISSMVTGLGLWVLLYTSPDSVTDSEAIEYFSNPQFIIGSIIGIIVYGITFWFLIKSKQTIAKNHVGKSSQSNDE